MNILDSVSFILRLLEFNCEHTWISTVKFISGGLLDQMSSFNGNDDSPSELAECSVKQSLSEIFL